MVGAGSGHSGNLAALVRGHGGAQKLGKSHRSTFQNCALQLVVLTLGTTHRFVVANFPGGNGTVERMMPDIVRALKALFNQGRRPSAD